VAKEAAERNRLWSGYRRASAFRVERLTAALESLRRLDADPAGLDALHARATAAVDAENAYVRGLLGDDEAAEPSGAGIDAWRAEAATLAPRRLLPGPIDVAMALQADAPALAQAFWKLSDDAGPALHDISPLMQYWADGSRTVAEIADLVELEMGKPVGELALRYFKLLIEAGLVRGLP
jgi:hypothetical protein